MPRPQPALCQRCPVCREWTPLEELDTLDPDAEDSGSACIGCRADVQAHLQYEHNAHWYDGDRS